MVAATRMVLDRAELSNMAATAHTLLLSSGNGESQLLS